MEILDSLLLYCRTMIFASSIPSLHIPMSLHSDPLVHLKLCLSFVVFTHLSATNLARPPWLLPVRSLIELVAMAMRLNKIPCKKCIRRVGCHGGNVGKLLLRPAAQVELRFAPAAPATFFRGVFSV